MRLTGFHLDLGERAGRLLLPLAARGGTAPSGVTPPGLDRGLDLSLPHAAPLSPGQQLGAGRLERQRPVVSSGVPHSTWSCWPLKALSLAPVSKMHSQLQPCGMRCK